MRRGWEVELTNGVILKEKDLDWKSHGVELVIDTTGQFSDPTLTADESKGALRGHLEAGAPRVILSAPFKIKDKAKAMPDDAVTCVKGINEHDYDPSKHKIISAASCTTTCLSHMIKPLLDNIGAKRILTASMATIHAATGSQQVLDRMAQAGATDLRKDRGILNNIILTTTGAAKALALVIPEMKQIGFIAESVRIPTSTGSLIILVVNIQEDESKASINRQGHPRKRRALRGRSIPPGTRSCRLSSIHSRDIFFWNDAGIQVRLYHTYLVGPI